jgi:hypothetical protein
MTYLDGREPEYFEDATEREFVGGVPSHVILRNADDRVIAERTGVAFVGIN